MSVTRRESIGITIAAMGAAAIPALTGAQEMQSSMPLDEYRLPVEGGEVVIHPIEHSSMVIETPGGVIHVDPVGGAEKYANLPAPALILITHEHGDHFDLPTLEALPAVRIIANPAVYAMLPEQMQTRASELAIGDKVEVLGAQLEAVPAYNVTPDRLEYHPEGRDNGYVLTLGGKQIYIAGDTEPTPEMLALSDIAVAFLPMNLPYTMTEEQAAEAVAIFKPAVVLPYHHKGSDPEKFSALVTESGAPTEVVILKWYS